MEIIVNGKTKEVETANVSVLIQLFDLEGKRFAIEINKELVPRSSFDTTLLQAGDKVEIVGAIGGG